MISYTRQEVRLLGALGSAGGTILLGALGSAS